MLRDLRFGVRMLLKQPGFTILAVVTLALGIGATAAVFSLIEGVLLTPPPYREPDRLVLADSIRTDGQLMQSPRGWAPLQWMGWQKEAKSLESVAAYAWTFNFLVLDEGSESLQGMPVTSEYFRVMGLEPVKGRTFTSSEGRPGSAPVIIIGYELWQRKFNGDPNIIGKPMRMSRVQTPPTIIGVMPPGVRFLPVPMASKEPNYNVNARVQFWVPAVPNPDRLNRPGWNVVARLRPGASLEQAETELKVLTARVAAETPELAGVAPQLRSLSAEMNQDGNRILLPLLGAAALVLLIACGNVAALLLVRGLQRQQEYAVRTALGMGRIELFRQVSAENLMLALFGGALGSRNRLCRREGIQTHRRARHSAARCGKRGMAGASVRICLGSSGGHHGGALPRIPRLATGADSRVEGRRTQNQHGRRRAPFAPHRHHRADRADMALLVGAGLLIRTMVNLDNVQSGFETRHILTMSVTAVQGQWDDFHHRALERVSTVPGVERAAFAWGVPLTGNNWPGAIEIEGQPAPAKESDRIAIPLRSVTEGYFALLNMPILDGRDIRSSDTAKPLPWQS